SDDLAQSHLALLHLIERHILTGFRNAGDHPSVLLWEEALGNDQKERNRDAKSCQENAERRELVPQDKVQTAFVAGKHSVKTAFGDLIKASMLRTVLAAQKSGCHHRRQR